MFRVLFPAGIKTWSMKVVICWFRRDLRLHDHAALYHALRSGYPVVPVFVFDTNILDDLEDRVFQAGVAGIDKVLTPVRNIPVSA